MKFWVYAAFLEAIEVSLLKNLIITSTFYFHQKDLS